MAVKLTATSSEYAARLRIDPKNAGEVNWEAPEPTVTGSAEQTVLVHAPLRDSTSARVPETLFLV